MALRSGGTLYWLLSDHLGSTAVTLSGTTEAGEVRYRAFGASRFTSGLALAADVGGLLLPGLTGVGMAVRGGRAAKAAAEAASLGDEAARLLGRVTTRAVGKGAQRFAWKPPRELKNVSFGKG